MTKRVVIVLPALAAFGCVDTLNKVASVNTAEAVRRIEQLGGTAVVEAEMCVVSLSGTEVKDDDLSLFENLPQVEILSLSHTQLTDEGLKHLESLNNLQTLSLVDTLVTPEGVARLQSVLSAVEITTEPLPKGTINPFTGKPFDEE